MRENTQVTLSRLVIWALVAASLFITPLWSLDPINPIKMLVVSVAGFIGLGILLSNWKVLNLKQYAVPLSFICGFVVWLVVVFAFSGGERIQQLFGTNGRNTGLITYFAFSILLMVALVSSSAESLKRFQRAPLFVGISSLGYGLLQIVGADPFDWVNGYSPVFGFLGNPNFQSSLLGILGAIVFTQLFSSSLKIQIKGAYITYLLVTLYVIKETASQQGFLVLLAGSAISLGVYIIQKNRTLGYTYFSLITIGFLAVLFGTLNKGPLASVLYKASVTYRGDYWRAGWKMTLENPIFGVGLDSYGDWYRRSRTIEATLRRGPEVTSNAAHNIFLDLSSFGGFPLVLAYIGLMVLVITSSIKVIKRSQSFNSGFVGLVAGWVAFQAQSIISINQIGLALWGWILSGLIIGYEINTRLGDPAVEKQKGRTSKKSPQSSAATSLSMFIGLIIGVLVGISPYLGSAKFRNALESKNPTLIQEAAYIWPADAFRMSQASIVLNTNNFEEQGLQVAIDATERFPGNYIVWATLNSMKKATEGQKAQALSQMKRLDPFNPNLK